MHDTTFVSDFERSLIERAVAGDNRAFEALMRPYLARVRLKLSSYFKRREDAEDTLQDLLLLVFRRLETFQYRSKFSTWLYRVCTTTALMALRSSDGQSSLSLDTPTEYVEQDRQDDGLHSRSPGTGEPYCGTDPAAQLEAKQLLQQIEASLRALPAVFSEAFCLRELEQMSYAEIAEVQQCPVGTVQSRIHRARQAVAEAIGHDCAEDA